MDKSQRTFIMVKPDGVQRNLVGEVISRFERRGLKMCGLKMLHASQALLSSHYAEHEGRPFFGSLLKYVGSGPVVAMCWEGGNSIEVGRKLLGTTKPVESAPGTIRGDYCLDVGRNLIHGSDSPASAARELGLWFAPEETPMWDQHSSNWIYE